MAYKIKGNLFVEEAVQLEAFPDARNDGENPSNKFLYVDSVGNLQYGAPFYEFTELASPVGSQATTPALALQLSATITDPGIYRLSWDLVYSANTASNDARIQIVLDGVTIVREWRTEQQDSAGTGIVVDNLAGGTFNSGTDQRLSIAGGKPITLSAPGLHTFDVNIYSNANNQEVTLYDASLELERKK